MRPSEVNNEQIIEAGLAIESEGRKVTGFSLRLAIGKGRPERLFEIWSEYKGEQKTKAAAGGLQDLSTGAVLLLNKIELVFNAELKKLALQLQEENNKALQDKLAKIESAYVGQLDAVRIELDDASKALEAVENERDHLMDTVDEHLATIENLRNLTQVQAMEAAELKERVSQQNIAHAREIQQSQQMIEQLRSELDSLKSQHNGLQEQHTRCTTQNSDLNQQLSRLNETQQQLQAQLMSSSRENEGLQRELAGKSDELKKLEQEQRESRAELLNLSRNNEGLQRELVGKTDELKKLEQEQRELKADREQWVDRAHQFELQASTLTHERDQARTQLNETRDALQEATQQLEKTKAK